MNFITNTKSRLLDWIKKNRLEFLFLVLIFLAAALLRLWNVDGYLDFKGDEGRDVRVVRRLIVEFDPILIGPRTSIGDMYLGPLYYYLIAPSLILSGLSPVGPAAFVALIGTATVVFVWWVGREWFGKVAGLAASALYAVSPVVIINTRDSWNPNVMPFFALLSIYSIWRVWQKKEWKWLVVLGVSFAFVLQSHYLGLLLLPTIGLVWLSTWWQNRRQKPEGKGFWRSSIIGLVVFAFLMSPLVIFDARHGWRNFESMKRFFTERQTTVSAKPWNAIPDLWPLWNEHVSTRLLSGKDTQWGFWVAVGAIIGALWLGHLLYKEKRTLRTLGLISIWILIGLLGLGLYKQNIFDHYFGFMYPAPFLLAGAIFERIWKKGLRWVVVIAVSGLVLVNLQENPLRYPPNNELQRTKEIDWHILARSGGKPFNFALVAERNYEESYLYFFELWGAPVVEIDPQRTRETLTDQLFVVCEDSPSEKNPNPCNPINHPKAEIANFGWARIEDEWEVGGFKVFKLVHTQ